MITISGTGRLGKDPKMQYTPAGTAQTSFSVATDTGFGDNKKTVWVSLIVWGKQAETFNQYLEKGSRVAFTAEVTDLNAYSKQDGTTGASVNAKVLTLEFLSAKGEKQESGEFEPEEF